MKQTGLGLFGFHGADSTPRVLACDHDHCDKEFTTQKVGRKTHSVADVSRRRSRHMSLKCMSCKLIMLLLCRKRKLYG